MEEKQNFPRATGFSGKILIASLFILSGILRYICYDSPPFHRWNHPFSGGCLFFDRRTFLVAGEFTGNGVAPRPDNSRRFIYLQTRQK